MALQSRAVSFPPLRFRWTAFRTGAFLATALLLAASSPTRASAYDDFFDEETEEDAPRELLGKHPDLSGYAVLTVTDLTPSEHLGKPWQEPLPASVADRLAEILAASEALGIEVRRGAALGQADELVLTGTLVRARRGHRVARVLLGPLARARLVLDLELQDASTGEELAAGRVKKLWAFPGLMGATRGFQRLVRSACREVTTYMEEARALSVGLPEEPAVAASLRAHATGAPGPP